MVGEYKDQSTAAIAGRMDAIATLLEDPILAPLVGERHAVIVREAANRLMKLAYNEEYDEPA